MCVNVYMRQKDKERECVADGGINEQSSQSNITSNSGLEALHCHMDRERERLPGDGDMERTEGVRRAIRERGTMAAEVQIVLVGDLQQHFKISNR